MLSMRRRGAIVWVAAAAVVIAVGIGVAVSSSTAVTLRKKGPEGVGARVAFYGDSYTLGEGATSRSKRWSTIICTERGWKEFNPSVNGLGFINNRDQIGPGDEPSKVIADKPDIVFITMGLNDNFSYAAAADNIHKQIGKDFNRLRSALPNARFVVVEPFWYTDDRPKSLGVIIGWVKAAAESIDADYIPGASHWIEHHPEWMAADRLHPNDAGYAHMAEKMDAALKTLDL
jgi:lysophospholipase L1-like esterase